MILSRDPLQGQQIPPPYVVTLAGDIEQTIGRKTKYKIFGRKNEMIMCFEKF